MVGKSIDETSNLGMGRCFQRTHVFPGLTVYENIQAAVLEKKSKGSSFFILLPQVRRGQSADERDPRERQPADIRPSEERHPLLRRSETSRYRCHPGSGTQ